MIITGAIDFRGEHIKMSASQLNKKDGQQKNGT